MEGTDTGHEDAGGMASVGVRLTDQLGNGHWCLIADELLGIWTCDEHEPQDVQANSEPEH